MRLLSLLFLIPALLITAVDATFYRDHVVYVLEVEPGSKIPLGTEIVSSSLKSLNVFPENVDWNAVLRDSKLVETSPPDSRCVLVNPNPPVVEDTILGDFFVFLRGKWYRIEPRSGELPVEVEESGEVVLTAPGTWKALYRLDDNLLSLSVFLASPFLKNARITLADNSGEMEIGDVSGINTGVWKEIFRTFVDVENSCWIRVDTSGRAVAERIASVENTEENRLGFYLPSGSAVVLIDLPTGRVLKDDLKVSGAEPGDSLKIHLGECKEIGIRTSRDGDEFLITLTNHSEDALDIRLEVVLKGVKVVDSNPRFDDLENDTVVFKTRIYPGENVFSLTLKPRR